VEIAIHAHVQPPVQVKDDLRDLQPATFIARPARCLLRLGEGPDESRTVNL